MQPQCLKCAAQLGLPQVEDMMKRMGISPDDLEGLNNEMMQAFGGAEEMSDLPEGDGEDDEESGKTATFPFLNRLFGSAGMHISIMVKEIIDFLEIKPGQVGFDATLGYGGHTRAMLECLKGQGHMYATDVDPEESAKTRKRLAEQGL